MGCEAQQQITSDVPGMETSRTSQTIKQLMKQVTVKGGHLMIPTQLIWDYLFSTSSEVIERAAKDPNPLMAVIAQRIFEHCESTGEFFLYFEFQPDFGSQKQEKYMARATDLISLFLRRKSASKYGGISYFESVNETTMEVGIDHEEGVKTLDRNTLGKLDPCYQEIMLKFLEYMVWFVENNQNFCEVRFDPEVCSINDAKKLIQDFTKVARLIEKKYNRKIAAVRKLNGFTKFSFCVFWFEYSKLEDVLNHKIQYDENQEIDKMDVSFDHSLVKRYKDKCLFSDLMFNNVQKQLMYFLLDQVYKGETEITITQGFQFRLSYLGTFHQILGIQFDIFEGIKIEPEMIDEGNILEFRIVKVENQVNVAKIDALFNYLINQMPSHQKVLVAGVYNRGDTLQKLLELEKQKKEGTITEVKLDFNIQSSTLPPPTTILEAEKQLQMKRQLQSSQQSDQSAAIQQEEEDRAVQPEIIYNDNISGNQEEDPKITEIIDIILQDYLFSLDNPIDIDCSKFDNQFLLVNMAKVRSGVEAQLLGDDRILMGVTLDDKIYVQIERVEKKRVKKSRLGSRSAIARAPGGGGAKKPKVATLGQMADKEQAAITEVNAMFGDLLTIQ